MSLEPQFTALKTALFSLVLATGQVFVASEAAGQTSPFQEKPDFTDVWTWNMEPGQNPMAAMSAASTNLPFTPEMRPRIEEYREMTRLSLENPGSYCVQFGMPQAMLFSGGYSHGNYSAAGTGYLHF